MDAIKTLEVIRQGEIGGGESHVLDLIAGFNKEEIEPVVLAFTDGHMISTLRKQGIKCYVIQTQQAFDLKVQKQIKRIIENENIQLIHAHGSRAASNMLWNAIRMKIPMIYTEHGWSFHQDQNPVTFRLRAWSEKLICHFCNRVICVSENNLQSGKETFGLTKGEVIKNGVNLKRFNADNLDESFRKEIGIDKDNFVIGFIGRVTLQKSPFDFIDSIEMAYQRDKAIRGLLIGEGDLKKEATAYIQERKLENIIYTSDFRTDVPNILKAIDVFCLPSLWEGLSIALLEAMSMKKAIVVTPTDGTREVIEDKVNGLIVDFKQPEKLAEAYLTYKNNKDLKQTCENNALKLVKEKFNSQRVSDAVLQIYKEVLA